MARKRSPYLTQAQALAVVKYDPEVAALQQLLQQAHDTFQQGVHAARGGAQYAIQTIDQARPALRQAYSVPGLNPSQAVAAAKPPPTGVTDFAAAQNFEADAATRRLLQSRADALSGLQQQRVSSAQGAQYGIQQARGQYLHDIGSINDRLVALAGEKGAYVAGQVGTLEQQAAQRALQRRGQNVTRQDALTSSKDRQAAQAETQRHNQASEKTAQQRADQAGQTKPKSPFTPEQRRSNIQKFRGAVYIAKSHDLPKSVGGVKYVLVNGLTDPESGKQIFSSVTKDPLLAQAAAERYVLGGVRTGTWARLQKAYGIKVRRYTKPKPPGGIFGQVGVGLG